MMKIFLDMDGVIVNFVKGICDRYNLSYSQETSNNLGSFLTNEIWLDLERDDIFWDDLPKFDWSDKLVRACHRYAETYILSAPGVINSKSASGKIRWLNHHYPEFGNKFILTYHKELLASENRLLIDDTYAQVKDFRNSGGDTILFPSCFSSHEEIEEVFQEIENWSAKIKTS